jgi:hypothetical protein
LSDDVDRRPVGTAAAAEGGEEVSQIIDRQVTCPVEISAQHETGRLSPPRKRIQHITHYCYLGSSSGRPAGSRAYWRRADATASAKHSRSSIGNRSKRTHGRTSTPEATRAVICCSESVVTAQSLLCCHFAVPHACLRQVRLHKVRCHKMLRRDAPRRSVSSPHLVSYRAHSVQRHKHNVTYVLSWVPEEIGGSGLATSRSTKRPEQRCIHSRFT